MGRARRVCRGEGRESIWRSKSKIILLDYETFEGIIPKGQYGGGTVMVWDRGKYYVYGEDPVKSLRDGRLHLVLDRREKAKGEWTLIRTRMEAAKPQWLLLKSGESLPALSKKRDDQSVKTGRTMKQIAERTRCGVEIEPRREDDDANRQAQTVGEEAQRVSCSPEDLPAGKSALCRADETASCRQTTRRRRLALRTEVRRHPADRSEGWRESESDLAKRKRTGVALSGNRCSRLARCPW